MTCPAPLSRTLVAEHVAGCARCRRNIAAAAERASVTAQRDAAREREHVAQLHADQARRSAEWPIERIRALMAEVGG